MIVVKRIIPDNKDIELGEYGLLYHCTLSDMYINLRDLYKDYKKTLNGQESIELHNYSYTYFLEGVITLIAEGFLKVAESKKEGKH